MARRVRCGAMITLTAGCVVLFSSCGRRAALEADAVLWIEENKAQIEKTLKQREWAIQQVEVPEAVVPAAEDAPFFLTYSDEYYQENTDDLRSYLEPVNIVEEVLQYRDPDVEGTMKVELELADQDIVAIWQTTEKKSPKLLKSDDPDVAFLFESGLIRGTVTLIDTHNQEVLARVSFEAMNSSQGDFYESGSLSTDRDSALHSLEYQLLLNAEDAAEEAIKQAYP